MTLLHSDTPLSSGPVHLHLEKTVPVPPDGELVPFFHFKILNAEKNVVGHINFRIGNTRHILKCAGHVGYEILPEHRGNSLSYHACLALRKFITCFYSSIILTVNPENEASIRIIEKLGATFKSMEEVHPNDPAYKSGARKKQCYVWIPDKS
ncbi:GNAT family N-acetyltransferase [Maridesulfovibrio salexigens]|uniref:GCN5-related N-acetyltransferase n=1 Tax=Maridesulfovibrio salexigens (strain ATCC 14822 / DSM 2638 / NCIMB 8403 / VKM B-1763) TaxID=526222 RepID=C6C2A5_MARSD|nr:GNAT family N-acetyltransferase [Maridesulfovibrio salexigens]ACS81306.1 GCN5-related N-acetyltransferase [Maridesulfovibrio salexigens DSM 2638]